MQKTAGFQPQNQLGTHKLKVEALSFTMSPLAFYSIIPKCESPLGLERKKTSPTVTQKQTQKRVLP